MINLNKKIVKELTEGTHTATLEGYGVKENQRIDPETGAAAKETIKLRDGDVIAPLYLAIYDEDYEYIEAGEFVLDGEPEIEYLTLFDGDFSYSMTLYDIFGNYTYTPAVTFKIDENGDVYFYSEEL